MSNTRFVYDHDKRDASKEVEARPDPIGQVPAHKIPIIGKDGIMRGVMGRAAGEPTARRVGQLKGGAKLTKHNGRDCWKETQ